MKVISSTKTDFLVFNNFSKFATIKHFVSTNHKKVNNQLNHDFDLSFTTGKQKHSIIENRQNLSESVNIPLENFVMQDQIHSDVVKVINIEHKGLGVYDHSNAIPDSDAMITAEKGICLFLFAADCAPVFFYDHVKNIIGAAHSGWKGTVNKIPQKTALKMNKVFGSEYKDIIVGIAPSISVKNYEIGNDVIEAVIGSYGTKDKHLILNNSTNKYHFDLRYTIKKQLLDIGILNKNIETAELCTFDRQDLFFSARGKKNTGRFGAGIMLS